MLQGYNFSKTIELDVPDDWIYKYYLDIHQTLDGQQVKMKSIFNTERTPSMFLFVRHNKYRWKDHSSGYGGDAIDLVKMILTESLGRPVTIQESIDTIKQDYKKWVEKFGEYTPDELEVEHYMYSLVCDYELKEFDQWDTKYWADFGVTRERLEKFTVKPLKKYRLGRRMQNATQLGRWYEFAYSYGFFVNGELVKIYNPLVADFKHVTLKNELLGREQLSDKDVIIIGSSMKDILTLDGLDLELDVVAPIGEKVLIPQDDIDKLREVSQSLFTLFDNDRTGIKAMVMYRSMYNIPFIYIPFYKDLAEFRFNANADMMKNELVIAINKKLGEQSQKAPHFAQGGFAQGIGYF